jgi:hypothetical protein
MPIQTKFCKFCKSEKSILDFTKNKHCIYGVSNKCRECVKSYRSKYNTTNKDTILKYNIKYNETYNKKWGSNNKHIIKWRGLLYRNLVFKGIKKHTTTEKILGYSVSEFKQHIELQFIGDMNWNNTHIDHKIPLTWFNKSTPPSIVNHLSNLQPMFKKDNISKLNRFANKVDDKYYNICKEYLIPKSTNVIP